VERCRTDDLMPNVPISCLPKCCHLVCTTLQGGALPYWRLDAKRPYLLPSSKPYGLWTPKFKALSSSSSRIFIGPKNIIDCPQPGIVLRRPTGLLQSAGGLSAAAMTWWWSSSGVVRYCISTNYLCYHVLLLFSSYIFFFIFSYLLGLQMFQLIHQTRRLQL